MAVPGRLGRCVCNEPECPKLSATFSFLQDPRGGFVELPSRLSKSKFDQLVRTAYLRCLGITERDLTQTIDNSVKHIVALHHFPPNAVLRLAEKTEDPNDGMYKIPLRLPEDIATQLLIRVSPTERVKKGDTVYFLLVPSYSFFRAQTDVQRIGKERATSTVGNAAAESDQSSSIGDLLGFDEKAALSLFDKANFDDSFSFVQSEAESNQLSHANAGGRGDGGNASDSPEAISKDLSVSVDVLGNDGGATTVDRRAKEPADEESSLFEGIKQSRSSGSPKSPNGSEKSKNGIEKSTPGRKRSSRSSRAKKVLDFSSVNTDDTDDDSDSQRGGRGGAGGYLPGKLMGSMSMDSSKSTNHEVVDASRLLAMVQSNQVDGASMGPLESERKLWFKQQIELIQSQLEKFQQRIQIKIQESEESKTMIFNSVNAMEWYLRSLRAIISDSFLDEKDKVIVDERKKGKFAAKRKQEYGGTPSKDKAGDSLVHNINGILSEIEEAIGEHLPSLDESTTAITEFNKETKEKARILGAKCEHVLALYSETETRIESAWADLDVAEQRKSESQLSDGSERSEFSTQSANSIATTGTVARSGDGWLLYTTYTHAVHVSIVLWEQRVVRLSEIEKLIKEFEEERSVRLKEVLLMFLPKRRRTFLRIKEILGPCLSGLDESRQNRDDVEAEIEEVLVKLSISSLKGSKSHRSSIMNRSSATPQKLEDIFKEEEEFPDYDIFSSPLIIEKRVIQTCDDSGAWKFGLAVVTGGHHLHVYRLVEDDNVSFETGVDELAEKFQSKFDPEASVDMSSAVCCPPHQNGEDTTFRHIIRINYGKRMRHALLLKLASVEDAMNWIRQYSQKWMEIDPPLDAQT